MRHLILMGCLALLSGSVLAEDTVDPALPLANNEAVVPAGNDPVVPSVASEIGTTSPAPEAAPQVEAVTKPDCIAPPPPPESDTDKLHKLQMQIAAKKLDVFRNTVKDTARNNGFFSTLFSSSVFPIDGDLLLEMDRFIARHPEMLESAEVHYLKAQVHRRMEAYSAAAVDLLMLQVAYPDSAFIGDATKQLKEFAGDQLKKQAATLKELMQKTTSLQGDRDHRIAEYLSAVGSTSNDSGFATPLVAECGLFLMSNQTVVNEDVVEHALAKQASLIDEQTAVYHFNRLVQLYPDSPWRPDSLLSMANVQRKGLKMYDRAAKSYAQLIEQYPDSPETKAGYIALARMYDEEVFNYPGALKTYEAIVNKYKDDPVVLFSLRAMAMIYQGKMAQPGKAIESYIRISEIFKGKDALEALNIAEGIAFATVRDWKVAINVNDRIIALVPKSNDAVKALFSNAEITDMNIKDKEAAKKLYAEVVAQHPEHALAKEAQKRIAAMEKKAN